MINDTSQHHNVGCSMQRDSRCGGTFDHYYGLPYVIEQAIIFSPGGFYLLLSFFLFSSPNLSGRRLDVYHTSAPGVALVRI